MSPPVECKSSGFCVSSATLCVSVPFDRCCPCCLVTSHFQLFATPWTAARQASPVHHHLPEFTQTHVPEVGDAIQPSHPLLSLLLLPWVFPSIRVFSSELAFHTGGKSYWSFNFGISPSNEYSGLISFRMDWLDLLAVQGTLKSLLQHHSSKASILPCSAFLWSNSHIHTWLLESYSFDYTDLCWQSDVSAL